MVYDLSLFDRITKEVDAGLRLKTPVQMCPFIVNSVAPDKVVFLVRKTYIEVSKDCWNGIIGFLKGKDWVDIGANHVITSNLVEGTLEKYLRKCTKTKSKHSAGSYVAPLLEHLGIVVVDHQRPSKVKLKL